MAYVQTTATQNDGFDLAAKVYNFFSGIQLAAQKRKVFNATYTELMALDDRELSDIGLGRSDIADIARKHAGLNV